MGAFIRAECWSESLHRAAPGEQSVTVRIETGRL